MALPKEMLDLMVSQYTDKVEQANRLGKKIQAETGGLDEKIAAILAEDSDFAQYREWVEKYEAQQAKLKAQFEDNTAKVREAAQAKVSSDSDFNVEDATKKFLELRREATEYRKAMGTFEKDEDVLNSALEDIEQVVSLKSGSKSTGTGREKPRMSELSVNGDAQTPATFSEAAKVLSKIWGTKVVAGDIQDAAKNDGKFENFASQSGVSHTFNYETLVDDKTLTAEITYTVK